MSGAQFIPNTEIQVTFCIFESSNPFPIAQQLEQVFNDKNKTYGVAKQQMTQHFSFDMTELILLSVGKNNIGLYSSFTCFHFIREYHKTTCLLFKSYYLLLSYYLKLFIIVFNQKRNQSLYMSHLQQPVYTTYPSPAMVINSQQPMGYAYSQHPSSAYIYIYK